METNNATKSSAVRLDATLANARLPESLTKASSTASSNLVDAAPFSDFKSAITARASACALETATSCLVRKAEPMRAFSAVNTTANPSTSAINSSSSSCSSCAASRSSRAMLNETLTDRSLPIELMSPNVVPPTPPSAFLSPAIIGTPLIIGLQNNSAVCKGDVHAAACEKIKLLGRFFAYHTSSQVNARRLITVQSPLPSSGKRPRSCLAAAKSKDLIDVAGTVFGTTMGSLCAYLEGRGVPGERAWILRTIRSNLLPVAAAIQAMSGPDVAHLSRGIASCRVVPLQRPLINDSAVKIDSKYGNAWTALGTTATLLVAFAVMSEVPNHVVHIVADNSFVKTLRCTINSMAHWTPSSVDMSATSWDALYAEKRALLRAVEGAREAEAVALERSLDPAHALLLQLEWAKLSAFPAGELISEFTQTRLFTKIRRHELFKLSESINITPATAATTPATTPATAATSPMRPPRTATSLVDTVPLSELGDGGLLARQSQVASDTQSAASSSWATVSSHVTAVSRESVDSLGDLVDILGGSGM